MSAERPIPDVIKIWPFSFGPDGSNGRLGIPNSITRLPHMEIHAAVALRDLKLGSLGRVEFDGVPVDVDGKPIEIPEK